MEVLRGFLCIRVIFKVLVLVQNIQAALCMTWKWYIPLLKCQEKAAYFRAFLQTIVEFFPQ